PGLGHESHQLAVLLAPSEKVYSGTLLYDASENIQLVSLRGPIGADEKPAKTWTTDGETIFELTFVDPKNAKGEWAFSGNALAVHTMKTEPFKVDYKILDLTEVESEVVTLEDEMGMEETHEKETMEEPAGPTTHTVEIPVGTSVPGCEENNACYSPADITINAGDTVEWINVDTAAHTVTGGSPADGPSGVFDSSLVMADATYAFTFDESLKSSFRNEIFPEYKANRDPAPIELKRQFQYCRDFIEALGICEVGSPHYEADDLIGTLATRMRKKGHPITILSADKDLAQLITEDDIFWNFAKGERNSIPQIKKIFGS
ncbi:MAG: hypothetical protein P8X78_05305, partial [Nitrosopumilaceae archaeon]